MLVRSSVNRIRNWQDLAYQNSKCEVTLSRLHRENTVCVFKLSEFACRCLQVTTSPNLYLLSHLIHCRITSFCVFTRSISLLWLHRILTKLRWHHALLVRCRYLPSTNVEHQEYSVFALLCLLYIITMSSRIGFPFLHLHTDIWHMQFVEVWEAEAFL